MQNCNLDCKYCYVYNRGDDSWKTRPSLTNLKVTSQLAKRIESYCKVNSLNKMEIEIHGGEPLLLGKKRFMEHILLLRKKCKDIDLIIYLQTNGLLLDREWLEIFFLLKITFSLSLDGPEEYADRNRVYKKGGGTTKDLLNIINKLRKNGDLFDKLCNGVLCVIHPKGSGSEYVKWFQKNNFKKFDFLIPDGNHINPGEDLKEISKFLKDAFDYWYELGSNAPDIRLFKTAIETKAGFKTNLDSLGGDIGGMCVVESNGAIGCHDVLRICGGIFSQDDLNIFGNQLGDHQQFYELEKIQSVSELCIKCQHYSSCGGGYLPHRFDGKSFRNVSYYCESLYDFYSNVENHLQRDVPSKLWKSI